MTTFTDKELIKEIKERIGSLDVRDNIERRAYEIALASLEAEPVGEFYEYKPGDWYQRSIGDKAPKWVPLYATPPVPELQADVAQAIENLKQKLVECNRYNYCADAVKGVEDACLAAMRHGPEPVSQTYKLNELAGNHPVIPDSWISCSERMPNDKQYVWCWGKSYGWTECNTFEGYYDWSRNKWWAVTDDGEEPASKVTHWMPLPEPPQG
ncbi:DUF551 domain-containing protein [Escherichia coli]|nr:DUF551 domain-containing protein [Escherichia coli]